VRLLRLPTAAAVALALALGACGDDESAGDPATTTTAADAGDDGTTTTTTGAQPEASTTTAVSEEGPGAVESVLQQLLVTAGEIGEPSFADVGYAPTDGPNVCGVDVDADVPPAALVGTELESQPLQFAFQQELRGYASPDEAAAAFAAGREGTACGTSTDGTVTLSEPSDVTDRVGGDQAFAVAVTGDGFEGLLVAAQVRDVIATFQFVSAAGAEEPEGLPDPIEVSAFGVGKVLAYLEG